MSPAPISSSSVDRTRTSKKTFLQSRLTTISSFHRHRILVSVRTCVYYTNQLNFASATILWPSSTPYILCMCSRAMIRCCFINTALALWSIVSATSSNRAIASWGHAHTYSEAEGAVVSQARLREQLVEWRHSLSTWRAGALGGSAYRADSTTDPLSGLERSVYLSAEGCSFTWLGVGIIVICMWLSALG